MDMRKLECFLAVAEEGRITKAAERLHVSQPPLSLQIKNLELELGVQLIDRTNSRRIKLTPAGSAFYAKARDILALVESATKEIKEYGGGTQGSIAVGVSSSRGAAMLPDLIKRYRAICPGVSFQLWDSDLERIEGLLKVGTIDLAISRPPVDHERYEFIPIPDEPMVAAIPSEWDMALAGGTIDLLDLADKPLIMHRRFQKAIDYYHEHNVIPNIVCFHNSVNAMLSLASSGIGATFVQKSAQYQVLYKDLTFRDLDGTLFRSNPISFTWLRKNAVSPCARAFMDFLRAG